MVLGWSITSAGAMNLSASPHEHRIRGVGRAEAIGVGQRQTGWVGPRARDHRADGIVRPAVASAMLVLKLIADAGDNASLRFLDFQHPQPEHSRRFRRRRPRRSRR